MCRGWDRGFSLHCHSARGGCGVAGSGWDGFEGGDRQLGRGGGMHVKEGNGKQRPLVIRGGPGARGCVMRGGQRGWGNVQESFDKVPKLVCQTASWHLFKHSIRHTVRSKLQTVFAFTHRMFTGAGSFPYHLSKNPKIPSLHTFSVSSGMQDLPAQTTQVGVSTGCSLYQHSTCKTSLVSPD